jgi:hypothetical protein
MEGKYNKYKTVTYGRDTVKDSKGGRYSVSNSDILTNSDTYDLLIQGIRDRFLNPTSNIILNIVDRKVIPYHDRLFSIVYDNVEYGNSKVLKRAEETTKSSISYYNDDPFDQAMYQNMLETDLGSMHMKEFLFVEQNVVAQLAVHRSTCSKNKMGLCNIGKIKRNEKDKDKKNESIVSLNDRIQRKVREYRNKKVKYVKISEHPKAEIVSQLYGINIELLQFDKIKYYFTRPFHQYQPITDNDYRLKQTNANKTEKIEIESYDYLASLEDLSAYHKDGSYYAELLKDLDLQSELSKAHKDKGRIDSIESSDEIKDFIALTYVKYMPNTFVLTVWEPAIPHINTLIDKLETDGLIYYRKEIEVDYTTIEGIMFWLYDEFGYEKRREFITKKMSYIGIKKNSKTKHKIGIIVFDNVLNLPIAGQAAKYKNALRKLLIDAVKSDSQIDYRGNDLLHINDHHYQTVEYCQNFFNSNTLKMIGDQDRSLYVRGSSGRSNLIFQTFRSVIYQTMSHREIDRVITIGSMSLYAHGIRKNNDIDSIVIDGAESVENSKMEKRFEDTIEYNFMKRDTKFKFADIGVMNSKNWRDSWTTKNDEWFNEIDSGPRSIYDMVTDPKHHFYFQGMKIANLDYEIVRKILRFEGHDVLDLIMMVELTNLTSKYYEMIDNVDSLIENNSSQIPNPLKIKIIHPDKVGSHGKERYVPGKSKDKRALIEYITKSLEKRYDVDQIDKISTNPSFKALLPDFK